MYRNYSYTTSTHRLLKMEEEGPPQPPEVWRKGGCYPHCIYLLQGLGTFERDGAPTHAPRPVWCALKIHRKRKQRCAFNTVFWCMLRNLALAASDKRYTEQQPRHVGLEHECSYKRLSRLCQYSTYRAALFIYQRNSSPVHTLTHTTRNQQLATWRALLPELTR